MLVNIIKLLTKLHVTVLNSNLYIIAFILNYNLFFDFGKSKQKVIFALVFYLEIVKEKDKFSIYAKMTMRLALVFRVSPELLVTVSLLQTCLLFDVFCEERGTQVVLA